MVKNVPAEDIENTISGGSENESGLPYNKVNTRSMAKKQNAVIKANNDASGRENDRGNRNKRSRNEYLETENENTKQSPKVVIKNQGVKKQKTSVEQVASGANKKGKSVKMEASDKRISCKSNHKGVNLAVVKRNDNQVIKSEANCTRRTLGSKCDKEEKKNSGKKEMISSSRSRDSNEKQSKKKEDKIIKDISSTASGRENEDISSAVIDSENEEGKNRKEKKESSPIRDAMLLWESRPRKMCGLAVLMPLDAAIDTIYLLHEQHSPRQTTHRRQTHIAGQEQLRSCFSSKAVRFLQEMDESNYFNRLPVEIVLHIFQYLSIKDLVNAKASYTYLKKVAEKRIAWKGKVWRLTSNNHEDVIYVEQLKNIPHVEIIEIISGAWDNNEDVMKSVLSYVEDIRILAVTDLSLDLISQVIQRYSNLESLCLEVQLVDSLYVLETLSSNCQRLSQLNLVLWSEIQDSEALNKSYLPENFKLTLSVECCKKICELLVNSFPELISINLKYFQLVLKDEDVAAILEKRKHKLQNLGLCWYGPGNDDLIKIISRSAINLDLTIFYDEDEKFDMILLKAIKSVDIRIYGQFYDCFELSCDVSSFSLPNVKTLELLGELEIESSDIVSAIVNMFPKLKSLTLYPIKNENVNDQVSQLKCLKDLTILSIRFEVGFPLSEEGFSLISQCLSLKRLKVTFDWYIDVGEIMLLIPNLENLTHLELYGCKCGEEELLSVICSVPNLKYLLLGDCINTCKTYQCWKRYEVPAECPLLAAECDKRNICLELFLH